jgi:hypothetical protein
VHADQPRQEPRAAEVDDESAASEDLGEPGALGERVSSPDTSAPEQKSPPAPVRTTARTSSAEWRARTTSDNSSHITELAAFLRRGRFIVIVTTRSTSSTISVS